MSLSGYEVRKTQGGILRRVITSLILPLVCFNSRTCTEGNCTKQEEYCRRYIRKFQI
jgi:hypothetical protein